MIDIDKIKGKSVQYVGETGQCFHDGQLYRIGFDEETEQLFTIDDDGDYHRLTADYIETDFDVAEYIVKPSMVGKYVRYIRDSSNFNRKGDIGIIVRVDSDGDYWVKWLNPVMEPTEDGLWCAAHTNVEFV